MTAGDTAVAADLLAEAVATRARALAAAGALTAVNGPPAAADPGLAAALAWLREVARAGDHHEALARGLLAASAVELDRAASGALLREIAALRRDHLHDARGAADALARALAQAPGDVELFAALEATLREAGDYTQLAAAYELHLVALSGPARARALRRLADLWGDVFADRARRDACLAEAAALDEEPAEAGAGDDDAAAPDEPPAGEPVADHELRLATAFETGAQLDAAIAHYEAAFAADPGDGRPLVALERIYQETGDDDALSEILGRRIVAAADSRERARLWYRRARLYRDVLHREPETYRCLKEAHANHPGDREIAHALRTVAMARGEYALVAELLYREIETADDDVERAALYLELALIFDEKLLDSHQAQVNFEEALSLDPGIRAAPAPLARLYELAGRHADAAAMGERAAGFARDDQQRSHLLLRAAACAEHGGLDDLARRLYGEAAQLAVNDGDGEAAQSALARLGVAADDPAARAESLEQRLRAADSRDERIAVRHQLLELAAAGRDSAALQRHAGALLADDPADLPAFLALKQPITARADWAALAELLRARASALSGAGTGDERAALFYELGRLHSERLGDDAAAVRAYQDALETDSDHPAALEALADLAYQHADWPRARALYERLDPAVCSHPADAIAYRRGEIAEVMGDEKEAAAAYALACRLSPSNRSALSALARTSLRSGDVAGAIAASRALLDLLPADDVRALNAARLQLGELCQRGGDLAAAEACFEAVLAEDPTAVGALTPLCALYVERGEWAAAARALTQLAGMAATPRQRANLLFRLGELYRLHLGDGDKAADAYLRAVNLDPAHAPTLRRLVDYYWRLESPRRAARGGRGPARARRPAGAGERARHPVAGPAGRRPGRPARPRPAGRPPAGRRRGRPRGHLRRGRPAQRRGGPAHPDRAVRGGLPRARRPRPRGPARRADPARRGQRAGLGPGRRPELTAPSGGRHSRGDERPRLTAVLSLLVLGCGASPQGMGNRVNRMAPAADKLAEHDRLVAEGDAAWALRADRAKLEESIARWQAAVAIEDDDADTYAKLARAIYLLADGWLAFEPDSKKYLDTHLRGIDVAERGLAALSPDFEKRRLTGVKTEDAIAVIGKEGVPLMYWYATNLGKWAKASGFATTLKHKDRIFKIISRVYELGPDYYYGAADRYFGAFYAVAPAFAGGDLVKSNEHFQASLKAAPNYLATHVLIAETYAPKVQDPRLFDQHLQFVLDAPLDIIPGPRGRGRPSRRRRPPS